MDLESYFDAVLVHGDENFVPLSESYPDTSKIADKLHYTGWVAPEVEASGDPDSFDVIVSAGGGAVGAPARG